MKVALVGGRGHRALSRALTANAHTLVWSVSTGAEAMRCCESSAPDVVLLDMAAIEMNAAVLTRALLEKHSCAVLLLAEPGAAPVADVYDAMGAGALDVVALPVLDQHGVVAGGEALLLKLRTAARLLGKSSQHISAVRRLEPARGPTKLVAIGASTGGPQALLTILAKLPRDFPGAIIIVQHVDQEFSEGLASWLRDSTELRIEVAREGDVPQAGLALIAGSADHLVMTAGGVLRYRAEPIDMPYRPSVDVLFGSLADHFAAPSTAVLLTGMGRDGAEGMKRLRQRGWQTIAQDEASSVVYGMPKAAVALGAACKVLSPPAIALELVALFASRQ